MQEFWSGQNVLIEFPKVLVVFSGVQNYSKFQTVAFLVMTSHSFVDATKVSEKHIASIFMCHYAEDSKTNFHCRANLMQVNSVLKPCKTLEVNFHALQR
jgi:hypothetical protein